MTAGGAGWEGLDPWEKIVQWREVAPEISDEILQLAKARAIQSRRSQLALEREQAESARFDRELAKSQEEHRFTLSKDRQAKEFQLANRMWWTQLIGTIGGLILIAALVLTQWKLAANGDLGPAITIFGMGGALTAGVYGLNSVTKRSLQTLIGRSEPPGRDKLVSSDGATGETDTIAPNRANEQPK